LREELAALDEEPLAGASGIELSARRADAFDRAVVALAAPFEGTGVAVLAVGGYGHRELTPGSDADLLFVHEPAAGGRADAAAADETDATAAAVSSSVLYPLWDAGIAVSHAIRTPRECRDRAGAEIESLTTLLGLRLLAGPGALASEVHQMAVDVVHADPEANARRLRASRRRRRERFGAMWRTLEPDLKEALGGLRDARLLAWAADYARSFDLPLRITFGGVTVEGPPGFELAEEIVEPVREAVDALLCARWGLHRVTGTRSNRLSQEHHAKVAELLGLRDVDGLEARDALLRDLSAYGRWIDLVVGAYLSGPHQPPVHRESARTILAFRRPVRGAVEGESREQSVWTNEAWSGGILRRDTISLDPTLDREPENEVPDWSSATVPEVLRRVRFVDRLPNDAWPAGASDALVRVILRPDADQIVDVLAALGFLRKVLPGWAEVEGRPQRDPYHRFPVDVHLAQTAIEAGRLMTRPGDPFTARATALVEDRAPLVLGALLHDIGKVGRRSHVAIGAERAAEAAGVMGLSRAVGDDVVFLVREHLLLSDTATRRNLEDEDLVLQLAARVGGPRRLAMLYLLTVADATATGPSAFTPWRMGLIRDLVAKVQRIFEHGQMDPSRAGRLAEAEARVRAALSDQPHDRAEAFMADVPPAYLLWTDPLLAEVHLPLLDPAPDRGEVRIDVRDGRLPGTTSLTVVAGDRLGLLSNIAGALTLAGLSIVSAQAFTTESRLALDAFEVRGAFGDEIEQERWVRFEDHLSQSLAGNLDLGDRVRLLRANYRPAEAGVPVTVAVEDGASDFHTVIEVGAADRIGLLFDLTRTFASLGLDVHAAKVATYGPRVVDVFYVTDAEGQKLMPERAAEVERVLRAALEPG
jgi:[protein-PII] uridylyltransferase